MRDVNRNENGTSLLSYALLVVFIALVALGALGQVGESTVDAFDVAGGALVSGEQATELTPGEKWEKAKEDHAAAIAEAKARRDDAKTKAKDDYDAAADDNKSLPKADRKAANQQAKQNLNDARSKANSDYRSSVDAANKAKSDAKKEYDGTK